MSLGKELRTLHPGQKCCKSGCYTHEVTSCLAQAEFGLESGIQELELLIHEALMIPQAECQGTVPVQSLVGISLFHISQYAGASSPSNPKLQTITA